MLQFRPKPAMTMPDDAVAACIRRIWRSLGNRRLCANLQTFEALLVGILKQIPHTSSTDAVAILHSLHVEDLVLAQACAAGNEAAWENFLAHYRSLLYQAAGSICGSAEAGRELADSLYTDLFGLREREGERQSPLLSYQGRGSLAGWLRSVLAQRYVDHYRKQQRESSLEDAAVEIAAQVPEEFPEPDGLQKLEQAAQVALSALNAEERFLLAAYYLDGHTLREIADLLKVHESTVSRSLAKLTAALRKRILQRLRSGRSSRAQAEELMRIDVRDLNIEVRKILQETRTASFHQQEIFTKGGEEK